MLARALWILCFTRTLIVAGHARGLLQGELPQTLPMVIWLADVPLMAYLNVSGYQWRRAYRFLGQSALRAWQRQHGSGSGVAKCDSQRYSDWQCPNQLDIRCRRIRAGTMCW